MNYSFIINDFEGPLDLLLHLVKTSKMDIYDIKVEVITKQYLDFISKMEELNLDVASEYLVMASELIELKSRMLLPREKMGEDDEYEEDPRENLVNRMLEFAKYKEMIETFKEMESDRKEIFTKVQDDLSEYKKEIENNGDITLTDLLNALNEFLKEKEDEKPKQTKITKKELSVTDRTIDIRNILKNKKKVSFFELFEVKTREYVVVTFLSILEMAKKGEIDIKQSNNFNEITVNLRGENND